MKSLIISQGLRPLFKGVTTQSMVVTCLFFFSLQFVFANDFKILVFHKTNGYRHSGAINASIQMFEDLGTNDAHATWTVDETQDASVFTDENLANYEVVIFSNTSGGGLLDDDQKAAMERFIQNGKGFIGIHAATDTYRNTDDDSKWLWYNELVGGIVQTSPNHTSNNTQATMSVFVEHPVTDHINQTWTHSEEWYYWELNGGQLSTDNTVLLEVEATGNNSYDAARPITWLKEYDGGRSFYTALGHNATTFSDNDTFREMLENAVLWVSGNLSEGTLAVTDLQYNTADFSLYPIPSNDVLTIKGMIFDKNIRISDISGRVLQTISPTQNTETKINISSLSQGIYFIVVDNKSKRFIKE